MMKKIAVVLSGCGVYDGSEIHEATLALLAIAKHGALYQCFAPDIKQAHVVNHLTGEEMKEERNVLVESARIARGNIKSLSEYKVDDFDAVVFPGGFGAAKNLSTYAFVGNNLTVNGEVQRVITETVEAGKPIGALCISPVIFARLLDQVNVTIGQDDETISAIEKMGAKHSRTTHGEIIVDEKYKLVTSPCYMLDASIAQIAEGADRVIDKILNLA